MMLKHLFVLRRGRKRSFYHIFPIATSVFFPDGYSLTVKCNWFAGRVIIVGELAIFNQVSHIPALGNTGAYRLPTHFKTWFSDTFLYHFPNFSLTVHRFIACR